MKIIVLWDLAVSSLADEINSLLLSSGQKSKLDVAGGSDYD
jgi:hypothetical protein